MTAHRLGRRAGTIAAVLAALGAGQFIIANVPDANTREAPFIRSAELGAQVDVRRFEIVVFDVRTAPLLRIGTRKHDTQGVWLVVRVRLTARDEPVTVAYAALRDGAGRTYVASDRVEQPLINGSRILQPGIPVEGDVVFELPSGATAGGISARFAVAKIDRRMEAVAEIRLLPAGGAVWLASDPITPAKVEVKA